MSQTNPSAAASLEGSMFLFRSPALLNIEHHEKLGITPPKRPFQFAQSIRAVPITVSEVAQASKHFPIIFADTANPLPLAVVGIIDDENLFVDENGTWEAPAYIPGYLRRYPFALAGERTGNGEEGSRMALIVDTAYEGINDNPATPFFKDGKPSEATQLAMQYCQSYEQDRAMTMRFAAELANYELLAEQVAQFTPEGATEPKPFAKYNGVDEKKFSDLSDEKFLGLRKSNILPIIYAQLMSMGNWRGLMERRARRHKLTGAAVLEPRGA